MSMSKKSPGKPRKPLHLGGQLRNERDTKKKVKLEDDEDLYHPQFDGTEDNDQQLFDNQSNSGSDDYDPYDDANGKRWTSSTMKGKTKARHDNSLSVLTRKFIQLIRDAPNLTVDLNEAVKTLNVQKRRIYDITNVLEGIGYIQKVLKNKIKWVGKADTLAADEDIDMLAQEIQTLTMEERQIDQWTNSLQEMLANLAKDETHNQYSFVTFDDIKAVNTVKDNDQPFLVIRAPKGTLLEVPNAEPNGVEEHPYKMKLTSQHEEISIYVVSNDNQNNGVSGQGEGMKGF